MKAPAPPRLPRALFIAAFAVAGAATSKLSAPPIARMTPYREDRRDRSIAHICRSLGRAIIATGRAAEAFRQRAAAYGAPAAPPKPTDIAALAIVASREVAALIGRPELEIVLDAPWIEVDREASTPCVRLYWRGDLIPGERMPRVWVETATGKRVEAGSGQTTGSTRDLDLNRFASAVEAARTAMRRTGVRLSSFTDVRRLNVPSLAGGAAFKGVVATIGLAKIQKPAVRISVPAVRAR